jgi:DNA (cytosine-5)-methyltransferase 1
MQKYLMDRNIGFDFKANKSKIPKLKQSRLEQLYKACIRTKNFGDISKLNYETLPDFDLFNFSFPCTDISVAGKQQGMKDGKGGITRSGLYIYGMNVIKNKKPKYIMIENVKNLVGKKFIDDFNSIIQELDMVGYNVCWKVLNAKNFGIPQNRERVFAICIRKDVDNKDFEFPMSFDNGIRLKDILEDNVDEKYYISQDKTNKLIAQLKNKDSLLLDMCQSKREGHPREYTDYSPTLSARDYKEPRLINQCVQIGELDIKGHDCIKRVYSQDGISPTLTTMEGGNRQPKVITKFKESPVPELIGGVGEINFGKQYRQGNRIYSSEKTAMCLMAQPVGNTGGYSYLYNVGYRIRKLTPKECWRLMGFDDEDIDNCIDIGISNSQLYKQAGNSIVVNVLYYIFKNLFKEYI